ncbi:MAG: 50S ribosomal protein L25 [Candidatus Neomarinimicrobiota bacterium]
MTHEFKLDLEKRSQLGRRAAKKLRGEGKIPGIFYSGGRKSAPFYIDRRHLHEALQSDSHVFEVKVGGKRLYAIVRKMQYHPVTDEILHIDLFGVRLKDKIDLMVPIVLEGEAKGVKEGGILTQNLTELQIQCLATEVPDAVHLEVSELTIGDSIHVGDLKLENVEVLTHPEVTVVTVQAPKEEIVEEEIEEEVEIEGEEEEEAEVPDEKEGAGEEEEPSSG